MKLESIETIAAPDSGQNQAIWVSGRESAFYITDTWKVFKIDAGTFHIETVCETSDHEEAYQMKGFYDKRLPDALFNEIRNHKIDGFTLLTKAEYDNIDIAAGSTSFLEIVNRFGIVGHPLPLQAHNGQLFTFEEKSISINLIAKDSLIQAFTIKTKGKKPVAACLHPTENVVVYTTNYGEIFGQCFDSKGFGKNVKIDNIQKPGYQIAFTSDGKFLISCGMGYVKMYSVDHHIFAEKASVQTSARSFEVIDNHLLLNKGMNGLDLFLIGDKLAKVSSADIPFAIDRMLILKKEKLVLLTSNPHGEMAFVKLAQ